MMTKVRSSAGFSLVELLVATGLLLVVSAIVTQALLQMTQQQATIWNRTEMHSGIRGATELLQQEIGQAGRLGLPVSLQLTSNVAPQVSCDPGNPLTNAVTVGVVSKDSAGNTVTSVPGIVPATGAYGTVNPLSFIFADPGSAGPPAIGGAYELLTVMDGHNDHAMETIKIASVNQVASTITACFLSDHASGTVLVALGGFATGIIPPSNATNPSTSWVLKMYGDINGDGSMVYVEYTCVDPANGPSKTVPGNLYRNVVSFTAAAKPATASSQILLSNVMMNPPYPPSTPTPCFTYQTSTLIVQGTTFTFVTDVAVTLTVQTQNIDPITKTNQLETKALLNVSPRNVFAAWEYANIGYTDRIQSTPVSITKLLP